MLLLVDCEEGSEDEEEEEEVEVEEGDEAGEAEEVGLLRRIKKPLSPRFALRRVPRVLSKVKMQAVALPAGTSGCLSVDSYAYARMSEGDPVLPLLLLWPMLLLLPSDEGLDGGVDVVRSEEKDEEEDSDDEDEKEEDEEEAEGEAVDAMSDKSASSSRSGEAKNWAACLEA